MKTVLVSLFIICGMVLTAESACSLSACSIGNTCSTLNHYISCLGTQSASCTASVAHQAVKLTIDGAKDAAIITRNNMDCSGAASLTVSLSSLLLTVMAALLKA